MRKKSETDDMGKMFRKITVRTVPDLLKTYCDSLAGYVFRGQANSKWRLKTTIENWEGQPPICG